jgi:transposase
VRSATERARVARHGVWLVLRCANNSQKPLGRLRFCERRTSRCVIGSPIWNQSWPGTPRTRRPRRPATVSDRARNERNDALRPETPNVHKVNSRAHRARTWPDAHPRGWSATARCAARGCGADLAGAPVIGEVRRQVIDLPPVCPTVVDHVAYRRRCACGTETIGEFPPEATAPVCWGPEVRAFALYLLCRQHLPLERTAELLADLLGAPVSTGWLCHIQREAAGKLAPFLVGLKARLAAEPVLHADETGTRVGVKKHWAHTLTTNLLTLIAIHPKRGVEAMTDIGVIGAYSGTVVHDGYASYEVFDQVTHATCGVHLIRHLLDVGQTTAFAIWTAQMIKILLDAKAVSETAAALGQPAVDPAVAAALRGRYHATLDVAFALLPAGKPPPRRHRGGWNIHQRKAFNLASRMRADADQVLRLLDDTRVPLDNNAAERALRMVKLHDLWRGPRYVTADRWIMA